MAVRPTTHARSPGASPAAALALCALAAAAQAVLPYGEFLLPGDVVRENTARLAIPRVIGADTVEAAWFHVHCTIRGADSATAILDTLVALDTTAPFEAVWNCAQLPDQDNSRLYFWCDVLTTAGEIKGGRQDFCRPVTLDRARDVSPPVCRARHDRRAVVFDGAIGEWSDKDMFAFPAGHGQAEVRARWTERFLFLAIHVADTSRAATLPDSVLDSAALRQTDAVEVYLDVRHERTPVRGDDDFRLCMTTDGRVMMTPGTSPEGYRPLFGAAWDSAGYSIEVGILWEALGFAPYKGAGLGFNVAVVDWDSAAATLGDWAGSGPLRLQNPATWGTMEFASGTGVLPWVGAASLMAAVAAAFAAWHFTRRRDFAAALSASPFMSVVATVLEEHYADPDISARTVAGDMHLSGPRLARMVRRETGMDFRELIGEFRIHKAKAMLTQTDLALTEIARRTGYESPSQFAHFFERSTRLSPAKYRARHGNVAAPDEGDTGSAEPTEPSSSA